ncbi:alpha/beta fold hydrolase [Actinacidiphila acidipaludis]|uniref:Alpha/beta hydrolase n=1 Tax=Actinacidiphila acidipaludis TaxID=2873382 RepID=A0ABS7QET2_9ACTN|nr:alpha/beta hydrolase [Streptomyces acidipaludis]MBY8881478.1 alpha/beta hydrolase [Streptomyces acidipaludis]
MPSPEVSYFPARDGVRLAYREVGTGRPLVLLHGITGDGTLWLARGQVGTPAAREHRVILPDFRGHGLSAKPQEASAYPPDVLTDDALALVEHLGLEDYDLGGYSLGARIVVRMLVRGAAPRRAVVGGQGLREVIGTGGGAGTFLRRIFATPESVEPGSAEDRAAQAMLARGEDPVALLHVLDSIVDTPVESLGAVQVPTLLLMGADDERAASAHQLADALPQSTLTLVPGDHGSAVAAPEFVNAMADFLTAGP